MNRKIIISLLIILAIASIFRLWQLNVIPPGLYPDEALNANQGLQALETGEYKVFYPENNGREGLFINLLGLSFSVFGISMLSFRIIPVLFGILTIIGIFFLTKEILHPIATEKQRKIIALLSSFLLATSFWHTNFSRIGFRAILVPFILTFSFYFLFKGFRTKKSLNFILAGIIYGIGFHSYISFRLSVLMIGLVFLCWFYTYFKRKELKKIIIFALLFFVFTSAFALPIGIYFLQNPQEFMSRATPISVFAQEQPIKASSISLAGHLAMFNFYGDPNWRHNFSTSPMLPWPLGIAFLIGLAFSIKKIVSLVKYRSIVAATSYLFLVAWFFIMLLPGVLTYEGIPHALRTIGVIPVVYIFISIGLWQIYKLVRSKTKYKIIPFILIFAIIIPTASCEFHKYFFNWAKRPETEAAFTQRFVKVGNYLNTLPREINKYVIKNEGDLPTQTSIFIQESAGKEERTTYLSPEEISQIKIVKNKTVIILMRPDENLLQKIKTLFPQGRVEKENNIYSYHL